MKRIAGTATILVVAAGLLLGWQQGYGQEGGGGLQQGGSSTARPIRVPLDEGLYLCIRKRSRLPIPRPVPLADVAHSSKSVGRGIGNVVDLFHAMRCLRSFGYLEWPKNDILPKPRPKEIRPGDVCEGKGIIRRASPHRHEICTCVNRRLVCRERRLGPS